MSAPESRRQRKRRERIAAREAAGVAYQVHPDQTMSVYRGDRLDVPPGQHVWIVSAVFITTPEAIEANQDSMPILMDREALALVTGPGCWVCEQRYSRKVAAFPCPGDPNA